MADSKTPSARPLSPHIQVYRWPVTMVMSILNRITGAALYVGTVLLAAWLVAAASGPQAFATAQWLAGSPIGLLVLFGYTWALMHHMLGGLRHFIWDLGFGHGAVERTFLSYATIVGSVVLTLAIWVVAFIIGG
jgi:succinate dehydrogenase / fumarate reductase, cytochrome b subunit